MDSTIEHYPNKEVCIYTFVYVKANVIKQDMIDYIKLFLEMHM